MAFVPLHNHSDYSLLDGASQVSKIVDRASELGMESIALTDHGVMYGVLDLVKKCKEKGIKPIIGLIPLILHFFTKSRTPYITP